MISVSCILSPGSNSRVQIKPLFFVKWHFLHFKCFDSGNWTVKFSKIPKQCLCFLILFEINDFPGHKFSISSTSSSRVLQERFVSLLTLNLHQTPLSLAIEMAMNMARFRSSTSKCCTVGLASRGKKIRERHRQRHHSICSCPEIKRLFHTHWPCTGGLCKTMLDLKQHWNWGNWIFKPEMLWKANRSPFKLYRRNSDLKNLFLF